MEPYIHKVQYYETDKMGITHHANYIRWMEEARIDLLEKIGWGYDKMEAMGISSPVIGIDCEYKASTTFGDLVEIRASLKEYKGVHLVVSYEMYRMSDGKLALRGESRHCFMGTNGKFLRLGKEFPELDAALKMLTEKKELE